MARKVDHQTVKEDQFEKALLDVLTNAKYKAGARETSRRLRDVPIEPEDKFIWWIEYTVRTGGASHLISKVALKMSNFVFYSLDVICVLSSAAGVVLALGLWLSYAIMKYASKFIV